MSSRHKVNYFLVPLFVMTKRFIKKTAVSYTVSTVPIQALRAATLSDVKTISLNLRGCRYLSRLDKYLSACLWSWNITSGPEGHCLFQHSSYNFILIVLPKRFTNEITRLKRCQQTQITPFVYLSQGYDMRGTFKARRSSPGWPSLS